MQLGLFLVTLYLVTFCFDYLNVYQSIEYFMFLFYVLHVSIDR